MRNPAGRPVENENLHEKDLLPARFRPRERRRTEKSGIMKAYLRTILTGALQRAGYPAPPDVTAERPRQEGHGDLTTNVAMVMAKSLGKNRGRSLTKSLHTSGDPGMITASK